MALLGQTINKMGGKTGERVRPVKLIFKDKFQRKILIVIVIMTTIIKALFHLILRTFVDVSDWEPVGCGRSPSRKG